MLFWVVFGLGATLRFVGLDKGIWLDEYFSIVLAHKDQFIAALRLDDHPPLYYILLRAVLSISDSEPAARLLSVVFGIATLLTLMLWMRRYSLAASILAGLIGGTAPVMLRFSQELRSYPILLLGTALGFYFAEAIVTQPARISNYLGLAIGFLLAVMSHLVGPAVVVMTLVYLLAGKPDWRGLKWVWLSYAVLAPALLFLFHYFIFSERDFANWWMPPLSLSLVVSVMRSLFDPDMYFSAVRFAGAVSSSGALMLDLIFKAVLVIAVASLPFGNWRKTMPLAASTATYVSIVVLITLFGRHIFWSRTLLPSLISLTGFVAVQLTNIRMPEIRYAALASTTAVCLIMGVTWAGYTGWQPVEAYKQIGQLIAKRWQPNSLLFIYPSYIAGPIRFTTPDLPQSGIVPLDYDFDPPSTEIEIEQRLSQALAASTPGEVFLLAREDDVIKQEGTRYQDVQDQLGRHFGDASEVDSEGMLSLRVYHPQRTP